MDSRRFSFGHPEILDGRSFMGLRFRCLSIKKHRGVFFFSSSSTSSPDEHSCTSACSIYHLTQHSADTLLAQMLQPTSVNIIHIGQANDLIIICVCVWGGGPSFSPLESPS